MKLARVFRKCGTFLSHTTAVSGQMDKELDDTDKNNLMLSHSGIGSDQVICMLNLDLEPACSKHSYTA